MKNFWKNKKVLVTGGVGFIGSHVVELLLQKDAVVTIAISPKTDSNTIKNLSEDITVINTDLLVFEDCLSATKDQEIILNFAALDGGASFKKEHAAEMYRVNTQIIINILEVARLNNVDRVLLMSSIDVYSPSIPSPILEEYVFRDGFDETISGYAWSKRFSEVAAKMYTSQYGLKIAIARPGNVYGPKDLKSLEKGRVIPTFIDKALKNEDITIAGTGSQKKSFLYVTDLAEALLALVEVYPECDPVNIASAEYVSLKELAELVIELTKSTSKIIVADVSGKSARDREISIEKAKSKIAFKEKLILKRGLKRIIKESI